MEGARLMKRCQCCYEEIQDQAKKCKHCLEWIPSTSELQLKLEPESGDPLTDWIIVNMVNSSCKCTMNSVVNDFMGRLIIEAFSGSIIELFDYKCKIAIR